MGCGPVVQAETAPVGNDGYDILNIQVGKDAAVSGAIPSGENAWVYIAGVGK